MHRLLISQLVIKFFANFTTEIDLISSRLSSRILSFSDEWFAPAQNLLNPAPPIQRPGVYVPTGAWYDGWETRRHNPEPNDWVIIKLGVASGRVRGVEIDTTFFDGNHAEAITVQGCFQTKNGADEQVVGMGEKEWWELLGRRNCGPSRRQAWKVEGGKEVTHVRLCMFPDGGIARFRLYGEAVAVFPDDVTSEIELSAAVMGGVVTSCSDERYGARGNLLLPGRGVDMGDGWETRRNREKGHQDWAIIKLGARGFIQRLVVDTNCFIGNYPTAVRVHGAEISEGEIGVRDERWVEILAETHLGPHREFRFEGKRLKAVKENVYTHAKMTIIPDGGVKRFRVFGRRC